MGDPPSQSYFPNNNKALFIVLPFANSTVGKVTGALVGIKAVTLNCTSLIQHLALEIKIQMPVAINVFDETIKQ